MSLLLFDAFLYAVLVSIVTLALHQASLGDGGLLSPIRIRIERLGSSYKRARLASRLMQVEHSLRYGNASPIKMQIIQRQIRDWNYKTSRYLLWRKPLLLCPYCMPSVWGTLLCPFCIVYDISIVSMVIGIMLSSVINGRFKFN